LTVIGVYTSSKLEFDLSEISVLHVFKMSVNA